MNTSRPHGFARFRQFLTALTALPVVSLATLAFAQPVPGNGLTFATSGSGKYRNEIAWFSWKDAGTTIGNGHQVRGTFDVGGETVTAVCTISNISPVVTGAAASLKSYKPGTWEADGLPFLYGIGGAAGADQLVNGIVIGASGQQVKERLKNLRLLA